MAVTALEIHARSTVLDGRAFGRAGAYETLAGIIRFAVDPRLAVHAPIADIALAPTNARGQVESWADFYLLRPVDPAAGNRRLLLDLPNRGRKIALGLFNSAVRVPDPRAPEDFGNGFLMRHGYTVAWVGWQPDVPRRDGIMALSVPAAADGPQPISGLVRCEFRPNGAVDVLPLADRYHIPHPVARLDDPDAELTVREHAGAPAVVIPRRTWRFARRAGTDVVPDHGHVHLETGFEPGQDLRLLLSRRAPAARRARLHRGEGQRRLPALRRRGVGQPLRGVARSRLRLRRVAERALPPPSPLPRARRGRARPLRVRRRDPSRGRGAARGVQLPLRAALAQCHRVPRQPLSLRRSAGDRSRSPGSAPASSIALRARASRPKIVAVNTSAEYWRGDASLTHIDVTGSRDLEPAPDVRAYLFAGTQHMPGTLPPPSEDANTGSRGRHVFNAVDYAPLLRAVLVNLDRWVTDGVEPPASALPRLGDGSAVPAESTAPVFRALPGMQFPDRVPRPQRLDFGPDAERGILAALPPKMGAPYVTFVSRVDTDGNETAGIIATELAVPVATFTGWNLRHPSQGAPGDLMSMMGSTIPLARTAADRAAKGDPRPSIAERYGSRDRYLTLVREAAMRLVTARHALAEDVDAMVSRAGDLWDFVHSPE